MTDPSRGDRSALAGVSGRVTGEVPDLGRRIRFNDETKSGVYVHKETNVFALT